MSGPSVIMCNMHARVFDSFCRLFKAIGVQVFCPRPRDRYMGKHIKSRKAELNDYAKPISKAECLDIKPDIVLCSSWMQLIPSQRLAKQIDAKLIVRAGNNNVKYRKCHADYLISSDIQTMNASNIKHKLFLLMPPDYEQFSPQEWNSSSNIAASFINNYKRNWARSWSIYAMIVNHNKQIQFRNYGIGRGGHKYLKTPNEIVNALNSSKAVLHVKEQEGYGWSMLETISCGTPLIVYRPFTRDKTCSKFLVDGVTCLFIDRHGSEKHPSRHEHFRANFNDMERLSEIHQSGHKWIRNYINTEECVDKLKTFIENTVT